MVSLAEFLSPEAGQRRRAWLDNKGQQAIGTLQYYLGPGVNVGGMVSLADMLNPVADIQRAGTAARGAVQPGISPMERLGYVGSAATDMASVLAPVAGAAYADDAARGLTEGLANLTMPADDAAARFFVDEDGAIRAWHGSPHDFDRFSLDKIGTGEGAQAYGHGLYFAENPETAVAYRDALRFPRVDNITTPAQEVMDDLNYHRGNVDGVKAAYRAMLQSGNPDAIARAEAKMAVIDDVVANNPGRLYEVNIDANPEDFLDWDAPLSAQPPKVREMLSGIYPDDMMGGEIARLMASDARDTAIMRGDNAATSLGASQSAASNSMRELGIPGIRYLDAGSRGAGDGSRNYVVFDDSLITILKKYGLAGVMAGGAYSGMEDSADAGY